MLVPYMTVNQTKLAQTAADLVATLLTSEAPGSATEIRVTPAGWYVPAKLKESNNG